MPAPANGLTSAAPFTHEERAAVYRAIFTRRDVRGQFLSDPIPDEILAQALTAAHHAPSVGFMQPWNFLVIKEQSVKDKIRNAFDKANAEAALLYPDEKRALYQSLKLEGITAAPINLCITCDRERGGPVVLGRTHNRDTDLYSTVCAVQPLAGSPRRRCGRRLGQHFQRRRHQQHITLAGPRGARCLSLTWPGQGTSQFP
jgi:5,6-dimethylbenzimidazole synthase